jgi:hypothetical protein
MHHVMIGEQEAVRIEQYARTGALPPPRSAAQVDDRGPQFFRDIHDDARERVERFVVRDGTAFGKAGGIGSVVDEMKSIVPHD